MTTSTPPTPPDEPNEAPTADEQATVEPPAAAQPPGQFGPPPPYAPYAYAPHPFAPRVSEPWVNPAKRGLLSVVAIIAALVLLGGGIAIGAAATGDGHGPRHSVQMRPYQGQPGPRLPQNRPNRQRPAGVPARGGFNGPRAGTAPTGAPSPAPSSSHS